MTAGTTELPKWREALESGDPAQLALVRQQLERLLRAEPERPDVLDAEVRILHAMGEDQLAERLLDEMLRFDPGASLASVTLAWLRWVNGHREEALAEITALLARDPDCLTARIQAMAWLVEDGRGERAEQLGREGLERAPDSPRLWLGMGLARSAAGHAPEGLEALAKAHELAPGDEEIAREYARLLLSARRPADAFALIEPFAVAPEASPRTWLVAARTAHSARLPKKGTWFLQRLATDPRCDEEKLQHEVLQCAGECLGGTSAETWVLSLIESAQAVDTLGVELLEAVAGQGNSTKAERVFVVAGARPERYPRTIARFLSTFHEMTTGVGVVQNWVSRNQSAIQQSTMIWAGVGAWHLARKRFQDAADHLVHWPARPGVRPWMILILGRALEILGRTDEANAQYRAALQLPPDHSEAALRSRLAFNMAIDASPASGFLINSELSSRGRQYVTIEDRARVAVTEALFSIERQTSAADGRPVVPETLALLADLKSQDRSGVVLMMEKQFVRRAEEMLSDERTFARD